MKQSQMLALALLGSVVLGPAPALAQRAAAKAPPAPYFPDQDWERRTPEAAGMDPTLLQEAIAFAVASERKAPRDLALEHNQSFLAELHPRVLNGSIWLFTAIAALILWYRLPVEPFHKAVLLSYVPYLLVFTVTMNVLGSLGWAGWERGWAVRYFNQLAYLALMMHWARAAWRRVEAPARPPERQTSVREPVSA